MKLIVNADDFGLTSGVNRGILDCFLAGSVTSTTLMVNTPATLEAVEMAKSKPTLGVGLHFNLTLGRPLCLPSEVPTLVDSKGKFPGRSACERRLLMGKVDIADIEREFHAQLRRFTNFAIPLTHVDSHQHIHVFPQVFDVLAGYCATNGLPLRIPWVWRGAGVPFSLRRRFRSQVLSLLVWRNVRKWGKRVRSNLGFCSIFDLDIHATQITSESYRRLLLEAYRYPFELMVHPALVDKELLSLTRITEFSEVEHRVLANSGFSENVSAMGFKLVSYGEAFMKDQEIGD